MKHNSISGAPRSAAERGGTSPLSMGGGQPWAERVRPSGGSMATGCNQMCVVELAPGYGRHVAAAGLDISRSLLLSVLPASLVAADRIRSTLKLPPRIDRVAPADECHCALRWQNGWHLYAHHPVVCGRAVYEGGVLIELPRSTALHLGVGGWPIVIRINETYIPL
jgi:hypothetical protein